VASNLASLCAAHHFLKTSNARTWRPVLVEYLHGVESHAA
jgi:hypothetical protein